MIYVVVLTTTILFSVVKTEICNFADDNTIFSCSNSVDAVNKSLLADLDIVLRWFTDNQIVSNPSKFHYILLDTNDHHIQLGDIKIQQTAEVKLLGVTIDKELKFDTHITNLCKKASAKIKSLGRIRTCLDLNQTKLLLNSYILSAFNYCPIVWMFCSKTLNNIINRIHKRALRIT